MGMVYAGKINRMVLMSEYEQLQNGGNSKTVCLTMKLESVTRMVFDLPSDFSDGRSGLVEVTIDTTGFQAVWDGEQQIFTAKRIGNNTEWVTHHVNYQGALIEAEKYFTLRANCHGSLNCSEDSGEVTIYDAVTNSWLEVGE